MASWSETTKHEPSSINGGQRYEKGDRVSREQLNTITENSFYAVNKSDVANANSENALAVANRAFEQSKVTGTQVTVGGVFQPTIELLDKTYPVGSIYLSRDPSDPAGKFGGSWEELDAERTLWITSSATAINNGNKNIEAGLPNITGAFSTYDSNLSQGMPEIAYANGAFERIDYNTGKGYSMPEGSSNQSRGVAFNAHNSNPIYKDGSTVQPPSTRIYAWIRIA